MENMTLPFQIIIRIEETQHRSWQNLNLVQKDCLCWVEWQPKTSLFVRRTWTWDLLDDIQCSPEVSFIISKVLPIIVHKLSQGYLVLHMSKALLFEILLGYKSSVQFCKYCMIFQLFLLSQVRFERNQKKSYSKLYFLNGFENLINIIKFIK